MKGGALPGRERMIRVLWKRSRTAVLEAGRTLFLRKGYAGTDRWREIAALAGVTKRTVYNNYADKDALGPIMSDIIAYAADFARGLREEFTTQITAAEPAGRPRRPGPSAGRSASFVRGVATGGAS